MEQYKKRIAMLLTFGFALLPLAAAGAGAASAGGAKDKPAYFTGKVVPLADVMAKSGAKIDADAGAATLVLQADDSTLYPLIKDDGSRMFFKDAKLLNRPMRLTASKVGKSQFLQVINVHSIVKGKLHDVYYWCDVCVIKSFEDGPCACCGDPMVFREDPYDGK